MFILTINPDTEAKLQTILEPERFDSLVLNDWLRRMSINNEVITVSDRQGYKVKVREILELTLQSIQEDASDIFIYKRLSDNDYNLAKLFTATFLSGLKIKKVR